MTSRKRRHFTGNEKVAILRRHLLEKEPVSELCDSFGISPTLFYQWQKRFFDHGASAFAPEKNTGSKVIERRTQALEEKLRRKDEVLGELMEEHVRLKKSLGVI